jgi:hypothetical protein
MKLLGAVSPGYVPDPAGAGLEGDEKIKVTAGRSVCADEAAEELQARTPYFSRSAARRSGSIWSYS